jgi:NAD(P)H-hydrate epimerase
MRSFVSVEKMMALDAEMIRRHPEKSFGLMKDVAREMSEVLMRHFQWTEPVLILCGPGNNGGDGYCLAEFLRKRGHQVSVLSVMKPQSADAKRAARFFQGTLLTSDWKKVRPKVIVDAIFGLNGDSRLETEHRDLLRAVNRSAAFKVALDVPTGVSLRAAKASADAFHSDLTLTVGYPKEAMLEARVLERLGELIVIKKSFSKKIAASLKMIEPEDFAFRHQKRVSHKGIFGKAAIIGGSTSMPGAAILAAEAAARTGAGYATLFFAERGRLALEVSKASFIFKQSWTLSDLESQSAWVLGCGGLPSIKWNPKKWKAPVVLDAEVFSRWSRAQWKSVSHATARCVLTPHAGEAAHVLGWKRSQIEADPVSACRALVEFTGQSVYLKGAPGVLIFSDSTRQAYVNLFANPAFARAGSGDILAGILGGFLAQRPDDFKSAVISALVFQSQMGEVLRAKRGLISSDQLKVFGATFDRLKEVSCG